MFKKGGGRGEVRRKLNVSYIYLYLIAIPNAFVKKSRAGGYVCILSIMHGKSQTQSGNFPPPVPHADTTLDNIKTIYVNSIIRVE